MSRSALLALSVSATLAAPAGAQDWRNITTFRQLADEEMLRVDVEYGAGRFEVIPGTGNLLYRANLRYDADVFRPVTSYANGRLRLGFEGGSIRGRNLKAGHLQLLLGQRVPLDLSLKFGAAEADLELGGLRIREAQISTGASRTEVAFSQANPEVCRSLKLEVGAAQFQALGLGNLNAERMTVSGGVGEVTLDFTGRWRTNLTADIDMGLGALNIRVPRGLGVRVRKSGILASFDSQGLIKRGDVYFSEDWEDADHRLTINIDAALGTIRFAWVDEDNDN
jgi:hypothetical protein